MNTNRITVICELDSIDDLQRLFGVQDLNPGLRSGLAGGLVEAELAGCEEGVGFLNGITAEMIITFSASVASGIIANAIFSAVGQAMKRIVVDGRRVRPKQEDFEKALETIRRFADRDGDGDGKT